jgi:iron(III) transport system substrate-binding protein
MITPMNNFLNQVYFDPSRRRFFVLAGGAMLGSLALKGCSSNANSSGSSGAVNASSATPIDEASLHEAAKQEGKLVYYMSYYNQEILTQIGAAFKEKYPGIEFEGTRKISGPLFQQLSQEMQAGIKNCDVYSTGDIGHTLKLKAGQKLLPYKPIGVEAIRSDFQNLDPENFFQAGSVLPVVIGYNTEQLKAAEAPKKWADLTQPKFKDKISIGSGTVSAQVQNWAIVMDEKYGWDQYFSSFNKLNPKLGRSINDAVSDIVSGERAIGIVPLGQILTHKAKGNPVEAVYPEEGAVIVIGTTGILQEAPHPNAAKLFMNFLMSKEYAELIAKYHEQPLRDDVLVKGSKALTAMKPIILPTEKIKADIPKIKVKWRDEFGA